MSKAGIMKSMLRVGLVTLLLLLVPALAMQFTSEVNWGPGDFVAGGVLLFGAGATTVLGLEQLSGTTPRVVLVAGVALGLAIVWAELAVGLFT